MAAGDKEERLQKILAQAGVASRRKSEELILAGRVAVDGQVVKEMGVKLDPRQHEITVDGTPLGGPTRKLYIMLHKPRGVLSTTDDPHGRRDLQGLVPSSERLFPVGRLDADSEGLVLLTNDGEMANRLMHPRYGHWRKYLVWVQGRPSESDLERLRQGVELEDGRTVPARLKLLTEVPKDVAQILGMPGPKDCLLEVQLREGRKRQVRRMLELLGFPVVRLIRVAMGPLTLGTLPPGAYRSLWPGEVRSLLHSTALGGIQARQGGQGRRTPPQRARSPKR
ncbi:MAG: rRNA pseudouridine synthase [Chloroflexi bacterium]|nr:rRNA pseudouridine synthase [Chloroflexota bacterium]